MFQACIKTVIKGGDKEYLGCTSTTLCQNAFFSFITRLSFPDWPGLCAALSGPGQGFGAKAHYAPLRRRLTFHCGQQLDCIMKWKLTPPPPKKKKKKRNTLVKKSIETLKCMQLKGRDVSPALWLSSTGLRAQGSSNCKMTWCMDEPKVNPSWYQSEKAACNSAHRPRAMSTLLQDWATPRSPYSI